ncbi:hypothetical protein H0H93_013219 [Arthromyces matolae]|nr:hypothetical protein H0H93_013219 [Arthromyces matolae]
MFAPTNLPLRGVLVLDYRKKFSCGLQVPRRSIIDTSQTLHNSPAQISRVLPILINSYLSIMYISDILNKTGVNVSYDNKKTNLTRTIPPNASDHPSATYTRCTDYLGSPGDEIPAISTVSQNKIELNVSKTGVPTMAFYKETGAERVHLVVANEAGEWVDPPGGAQIAENLGAKVMLQVELDGDYCKVLFFNDNGDLQPSGKGGAFYLLVSKVLEVLAKLPPNRLGL